MKAPKNNEKVITPSCGCHDNYCVCVFVKACGKNDSIIYWNGIGRSKRHARHDNSDGNNDHKDDDDENISCLPDFESLSFELEHYQIMLNELN